MLNFNRNLVKIFGKPTTSYTITVMNKLALMMTYVPRGKSGSSIFLKLIVVQYFDCCFVRKIRN